MNLHLSRVPYWLSGGYSNSYPLSERGCVCVCVRTNWGIVALKNAQCFLYLSVGLDGLAGRREKIEINGNGKVGKRKTVEEGLFFFKCYHLQRAKQGD